MNQPASAIFQNSYRSLCHAGLVHLGKVRNQHQPNFKIVIGVHVMPGLTRHLSLPRGSNTTTLCHYNPSQRLAPPYLKTLITINTFKAGHSASRCPAKQAADSCTIPSPTQKNPTFTNSPVRWPGKKAEHSFFLDFFVTFFVQEKK